MAVKSNLANSWQLSALLLSWKKRRCLATSLVASRRLNGEVSVVAWVSARCPPLVRSLTYPKGVRAAFASRRSLCKLATSCLVRARTQIYLAKPRASHTDTADRLLIAVPYVYTTYVIYITRMTPFFHSQLNFNNTNYLIQYHINKNIYTKILLINFLFFFFK